MSSSMIRTCVWLTVWGLTVTGTLASADWPVNWRYSVCGAWGCGPPFQALVACHTSWLVVLIPFALGIRRYGSSRMQLRIAAAMFFPAMIGAMGVGIHEALTWLPQASESQRAFYWHRVGFVILTTVELPLLQIAGLASVVVLGAIRHHLPDRVCDAAQ